MSTRSIIAIPEGDGWKGRYVHYDGYPAGVGQTVWHIVKTAGLAEAARILTSKPIGWSIINDNPDGIPRSTPATTTNPDTGTPTSLRTTPRTGGFTQRIQTNRGASGITSSLLTVCGWEPLTGPITRHAT